MKYNKEITERFIKDIRWAEGKIKPNTALAAATVMEAQFDEITELKEEFDRLKTKHS